ncbi:MAG TPA: glycosyltransferase [Caulobacteraceae bacterium]|nr:glycosyltransferase [Caulobacteraceae bacterium]
MIVIVLNRRYAPLRSRPADAAGVTSFVRSLIAAAKVANLPVAMILFDRDEAGWRERGSEDCDLHDCPAVLLPFSFTADREIIAARFDAALKRFGCGQIHIYAQSGVYAPYLPDRAAVFTHHGPFVDEVEKALGAWEAVRAYDGGEEKITALRRSQQEGLRELKAKPAFLSLEISPIQVQSLLRADVPRSRVRFLMPTAPYLPEAEPLPESAERWLADRSETRLFTACARIDSFKNLSEIVEACKVLESGGKQASAFIAAGGAPDADRYRDHVRGAGLQRSSIYVSARLRPGQLNSLFTRAAAWAPFVFPSKYETLGMTPLQAKYHGCSVLCRDDRAHVGVANFLKSHELYQNGPVGLASSLAAWRPETCQGPRSTPTIGGQDHFHEILRSVVEWR